MKSATRATLLLVILSAAVSLVRAHGSVSDITLDGQHFTGPVPGSGPNSNSPVREISTLEPITDPSSQDMRCGRSAAPSAKVVANVTAGGSVTFGWRSGESGINWPHRWGPCMGYLYQCPDGVDASDCVPPTGAEWLLFDAQGFDPKASEVANSTGWMQDRFHAGMTVSSRIPANLPSGNYLLRHELIALHKGDQIGGAEYYVSCSQIRVTGGSSGRATKTGAELVAIPGVYKETDPGIHVNVFDGNLNAGNYKMPGPAVFGATGSGGTINTPPSKPGSGESGNQDGQNDGTPAPAPTSAPTESAPNPTTTSTSTVSAPTPSKSNSCKRVASKRALRKRKQARELAAAAGVDSRSKPRRISNLHSRRISH